jgi:hypothetical protein
MMLRQMAAMSDSAPQHWQAASYMNPDNYEIVEIAVFGLFRRSLN